MESLLAHALGATPGPLADDEKRLLLSRLLARLSHEIRNPLSSLDVHVQLLHEDLQRLPADAFAPLGRRLEIIRDELHRLDHVVQRFLHLAHPSEAQLQTIDVERLLHDVCELLRPEADARGITLQVRLAAPLPPLQADPVQFTQALVNLLINAIQAVKRDGRIELGADVDPAAGQLQVFVRDSGPGVPPERQAAIFEPFFTTRADGSGLGLWIVRQIAAAHHGTIGVANAAEGGAVFTLRLPLQARIDAPNHG